jgi:hypothetical protein
MERHFAWYHGGISRVEAESIIEESGFVDHSFLVRKCVPAVGAVTHMLTVCHGNQITHHSIYSRAAHANSTHVLYSLSDSPTPSHSSASLDALVGTLSTPSAPFPGPLRAPLKNPVFLKRETVSHWCLCRHVLCSGVFMRVHVHSFSEAVNGRRRRGSQQG